MSVDAVSRVEQIQARVERDGQVTVGDLAHAFAVSEMTIRRDLDALAERGALRRVRGGAMALGPAPFAERFERRARAKERIADKLIGLVGDGGAIGLDASTTLQRLTTRLHDVHDLTVITNGPESFAALQPFAGVTPLLTGGRLDARTGSLVGPLTSRAVRDFALRRLFVSAAAIDPIVGATESTLEDAEAKLAFADVTTSVVVAVDASKLDQRAPARSLSLDRIDVLVTDLDPDHPRLDPYRDLVEIR